MKCTISVQLIPYVNSGETVQGISELYYHLIFSVKSKTVLKKLMKYLS